MIEFLAGHPRYLTANSWNRSTSYGRYVKLLGIDFPSKEAEDRAYEIIEADSAWWWDSGIKHEIQEFGSRYDHRWQIGTNGRSGGYLVLYTGGSRPSAWRSWCIECGQRNYQKVDAEPGQCGCCRAFARINYETPPLDIFSYPFKSVDEDQDFQDWDTEALRERTRVVLDFDRTVDRCLEAFVRYCRDHQVVEEEVLVPRTRHVVVPIGV